MSYTFHPADQKIRELALQSDQSFIVQAPAGSGKTGLLTQRYLKLLSEVDQPEEIIAITFTRKAADEMRERIITALLEAEHGSQPQQPYEQSTWQLAKQALQQDKKQNWCLLQYPARCRVQTIDSLTTELARQMPVMSEFGSIPAVIEDASALYLEAAAETLSYLESNKHDWGKALAVLLQHQDNQMNKVQLLISEMLARRDQWLRHVADLKHPQLRREQIEPVLTRLVEQALIRLQTSLSLQLKQRLPKYLRFAANNVSAESKLAQCRDMQSLPDSTIKNLPLWRVIAEFLLTASQPYSWRKTVNVKNGFPAASAANTEQQKQQFILMKKEMIELLQDCQAEQTLRENLAMLHVLPCDKYSDDEWLVLQALFKVLLFSAAQLRVVFSTRGEVDFIEMALAAKRALGSELHATELTLRMDYRLKHLLVDEFQDSSQNQFDLFKQLTMGWQTGDGRSLFLVGDPMQSIYRFREAEVGLFLQAWETGLGSVRLVALNLTVNFRSQAAIIDWINDKFPIILPTDNDRPTGAVRYTNFEAVKPALKGLAVSLHPMFGRNDVAEANTVLSLIQQAKLDQPNANIAVLCRNRTHLVEIIHLLNVHSVAYQAVEIDALEARPIVQDLIALTRALLHYADRIAWLALLRAPYIGLSLLDIHTLVFDNESGTVIECLMDESRVNQLTPDAQQRLQRVCIILKNALQEKQRKPLRLWIEGLWLTLGGPACCKHDTDLADAEVFFQLLEKLNPLQHTLDAESLQFYCHKLFALPDVRADDQLQLMTIHKAKGLEFDTVIIPGLGKKPRSDSSKLLYWLERTSQQAQAELIFSPIKSAWEKNNQTTDYIKLLEQEKNQYEIGRLLYVAVTRAKQRLHLLGHVNIKSDQSLASPASSSLLEQLWPIAEQQYLDDYENQKPTAVCADIDNNNVVQCLSRQILITNWQTPDAPDDINIKLFSADSEIVADIEQLEFSWASDTARHVGSVVHRFLQQWGDSPQTMLTADFDKINIISGILLTQLGVVAEDLEQAKQRVLLALKNTLEDKRGLWILSNVHQDAHCEFKITAVVENKIQHMIIDRTFVDENNIRWVIDYKTGSHTGSGIEAFLDQEQQRYLYQLEAYASAMKSLENKQLRKALYFPLMQQWREWT